MIQNRAKLGRRLGAVSLLEIGLCAHILRPKLAEHFVFAGRLEQLHRLRAVSTTQCELRANQWNDYVY
jgi:hypothetical protein